VARTDRRDFAALPFLRKGTSWRRTAPAWSRISWQDRTKKTVRKCRESRDGVSVHRRGLQPDQRRGGGVRTSAESSPRAEIHGDNRDRIIVSSPAPNEIAASSTASGPRAPRPQDRQFPGYDAGDCPETSAHAARTVQSPRCFEAKLENRIESRSRRTTGPNAREMRTTAGKNAGSAGCLGAPATCRPTFLFVTSTTRLRRTDRRRDNEPYRRRDCQTGLASALSRSSRGPSRWSLALSSSRCARAGSRFSASASHGVPKGARGGRRGVAHNRRLFAALKVVRKGHRGKNERAGLVAGYLGIPGGERRSIVPHALDGVLFIDERQPEHRLRRRRVRIFVKSDRTC